MELWACGFNAWGQLQVEGDLSSDPHDLYRFQPVLEDRRIEILKTAMSATLGKSTMSLCYILFQRLMIQPQSNPFHHHITFTRLCKMHCARSRELHVPPSMRSLSILRCSWAKNVQTSRVGSNGHFWRESSEIFH